MGRAPLRMHLSVRIGLGRREQERRRNVDPRLEGPRREGKIIDGAQAPQSWGNTSLTIVDWPAPWRVRLLNCVAHLDGLDAAPPANSGAA